MNTNDNRNINTNMFNISVYAKCVGFVVHVKVPCTNDTVMGLFRCAFGGLYRLICEAQLACEH